MKHVLPELPYGFDDLEPEIDAKTMEIHYSKHHQGYVDKLNSALENHPELKDKTAEELLADLESIPKDIKQAVINHAGGHANHSMFWQIMNKPPSKPSETLLQAMKDSFGSPDDCQKLFIDSASKLFGSGWTWIVVNNDKKLEILSTKNQESPISKGFNPILGIDLWEHAYYLKYQNNRSKYINAWENVINWNKVDELYRSAIN